MLSSEWDVSLILGVAETMEGQEFLTEYRSISNKLKKRFLRSQSL